MLTKREIRKANKEKRLTLSDGQVEEASRNICQKIVSSDMYKRATNLFVYSSINKEVKLDLLVEAGLKDNKSISFPKVVGDDLFFYKIDKSSELFKGYFGIMEPDCNNSLTIPNQSTLVIVPGLAFSKEGHRIGYGKGFYDRYFAKYKELMSIGVCYDFQIAEPWTVDSNDKKVMKIFTEKREVISYDKA